MANSITKEVIVVKFAFILAKDVLVCFMINVFYVMKKEAQSLVPL